MLHSKLNAVARLSKTGPEVSRLPLLANLHINVFEVFQVRERAPLDGPPVVYHYVRVRGRGGQRCQNRRRLHAGAPLACFSHSSEMALWRWCVCMYPNLLLYFRYFNDCCSSPSAPLSSSMPAVLVASRGTSNIYNSHLYL